MPELSYGNIDQISNDIRNEDISFSHLLDNLIDHVCCDVEDEMRSGLDFQEAYGRVKLKMGSDRRFREIQEETLYAVDTKYRKMKNTMKISGITGTIIFGFAALFKIQHWPGAGIMLTIGALILAIIFLPSSLTVLWKETHNMKRLVLFASGFLTGFTFIFGTLFKVQHWPLAGVLLMTSVACAAILFIPALLSNRLRHTETVHKKPVYFLGSAGSVLYAAGLLFKIQHWPAASELIMLGLLILVFIAFPWYTYITWKDEAHVKAKFILLLIAAFLIILPGALINLNLQDKYESGFFPHLEKQKVLLRALSAGNAAFLNSHRDSADFSIMQMVHNKTVEMTGLITSIEMQLINESEDKTGKPEYHSPAVINSGNITEIRYELLRTPFDSRIAASRFVKGSAARNELENALGKYIGSFSTLVSPDEFGKLKLLADPDENLPDDLPAGGNFSLLSALHSTALLKNNIAVIESRVMRSVADKLF